MASAFANAAITGTIQGNNTGSQPIGSISLSNGTLSVTASEAHTLPTLCSPLTFAAGTTTGSFGFSGGAVSRDASSVTFQIQSVASQTPVTCAGIAAGNQCSSTTTTGSCVWCADFSGNGTIAGTQSLSPSLVTYSATVNGTESPVDTSLGLQFVPVEPCRVADTRNATGPYGQPVLRAASTRDFVLSGRCGIPAQVSAVALNVTVVPRGPLGFLTI